MNDTLRLVHTGDYTLCLKKRVNFETLAQKYKDLFWWDLAEIFKILQNRVCMLHFSCRFAFFINFSSFKLDTENNTNFED